LLSSVQFGLGAEAPDCGGKLATDRDRENAEQTGPGCRGEEVRACEKIGCV
jgi:hypothetical protein